MLIFLSGCSSSRFSAKKNYNLTPFAPVRVLMSEAGEDYRFLVEQTVILSNEEKEIAVVKSGNSMYFETTNNYLQLKIADRTFRGKYFSIRPDEEGSFLYFNNKKYRGIFKFINEDGKVRLINSLPLEEYVMGVVPAEMPVGKNNDYFEALKAFAICVRTYAISKMSNSNSSFDVYLDTRDQVYGGESAEKKLSNQAVEETKNLILAYDGKPAIVYYHSTCGGHTEKASNVFPVPDLPYLKGVIDGDPPNCSSSPNFNWEEKFPDKLFIQRLADANLINRNNYKLTNVEVIDRDESGRVKQLSIKLTSQEGEEKTVSIQGNRIRYVLKQANSSGILKSTLFDITMNNNYVIINGRGNGHGVGLCQWGALHLSVQGESFNKILSFYFPGTNIMEYK